MNSKDPNIENLTQAIQRNPTDYQTYRSRGEVYRAKGDHARAQADFDNAKQLREQ